MSNRTKLYNLLWDPDLHPLLIEMEMVKRGGRWTKRDGSFAGISLAHHFQECIKLIWEHIVFHRWNRMFFEEYNAKRTVVVTGPASSGKTNSAALCLLLDYYCFPDCTTGIICSTTKERLEDRVWGEIKSLHKAAKRKFSFLPGNLIEGKQRLVTDDRNESEEGRDFRNGVVGVPCKVGGSWVGLGSFAGIKNKRVRLLGDELSLLPRIFVDVISNLDKNPDFKTIGLGNPKDTTDALGVLAEPSTQIGGWESGIDQVPKSKTWATRRPDGVCIQYVGSDSPNLDGKLGIPLITQEQIDRDVAFYGRDSAHFYMMDEGMMPRGQGNRRVITRQLCLKHRALEEPVWLNTQRTKVAALDAAYRAVGGDRCVFGALEFGYEAPTESAGELLIEGIINQKPGGPDRQQILALVDVLIVPIKPGDYEEPEVQIVNFVKQQCETRGIPPENFYYDSGMRTSLVNAFARLWSVRTNPIDCGGTPSKRKVSANIDVLACDYFQKKVTELWFSVRLIIEADQFRGMTEEVMNEGCMREWKTVGANKIEVETKEEMKTKTSRSPDLFDMLTIACEGARQLGFVIRRLGNKLETVRDDRWKNELRAKAKELNKAHSLNYAA